MALVLPKLPEIAGELAHVTDTSFWLDLGRTLFAKALPDLETIATGMLAKL